MSALTKASQDVLAERQRQVSAEGWTPDHDDEHRDGAMAIAAACYAMQGLPSRVTIEEEIRQGRFPKPRQLRPARRHGS
jgi:hypothetical protein